MSINPPIQVTVSERFATEIRQLAKCDRRIRLDSVLSLLAKLECVAACHLSIAPLTVTLAK